MSFKGVLPFVYFIHILILVTADVTYQSENEGIYLNVPQSETNTDKRFLFSRIGWSHWTSWSRCSKSCAGGVRSRSRQCIDLVNRRPVIELGCINPLSTVGPRQTEYCNQFRCPVVTSTVATHISTRHLKTVPDTSSTSTVTTSTTTTHLKTVRDTSSTSTVTTSTTPAITSSRTSPLPVTHVCVDAPLCNDPHTKSSACNDNYIAAKYCPKMCGVCGGPLTTTPVQCTDKAGPKCKDSIFRIFACADTDLKDICAKTCQVCH